MTFVVIIFDNLGSALGITLLGMLVTGHDSSIINRTKMVLLLFAFLMMLRFFYLSVRKANLSRMLNNLAYSAIDAEILCRNKHHTLIERLNEGGLIMHAGVLPWQLSDFHHL